MRIAFVHDWEPDIQQMMDWKDGLSAALKVLSSTHEVALFTVANGPIPHEYHGVINGTRNMMRSVAGFKPDVILYWGDMTRPNAAGLRSLAIPIACCFAGGDPLGDNVDLFDHIFVESQVYKDKLDEAGKSCSIAFGTNTELFRPMPAQPKLFDTIFPATFAAWKRHNLYAEVTEGLRSLAVGYMYEDHESECWEDCLKRGVMVMPHTSAETLRYLYAASKVCVVTSSSAGGSQRTVLEAMSMDMPLLVTDSDKFDYIHGIEHYRGGTDPAVLRAIINKSLNRPVNTRQYILQNWSEVTYANSLIVVLEGLRG